MNLMGKVVNRSTTVDQSQRTDFNILKKPEWYYHADNFSVHFEIIDDNILHGIATGMFKEDHVEPAIQLKEIIIRSISSKSKPYFIVLGLSKTKSVSQKGRLRYVEAILKLYKNQPFHMLIFYDANRLLTAAINLAKPFVPFKVKVAKTFEEAIEFISENKHYHLLPTDMSPPVIRDDARSESRQITSYVEEMLSYIENINWEVDGINQPEEKDSAHPFYKVFEALKLIKWELDDLYQQRNLVEEALRKSEAKFRKIVEASPMGMHMYTLEPGGRLVFTGANPAADSILGVENKNFVGNTIEEAFPPLINTEIPDHYRQICDTGCRYRNEQVQYTDGKIKGVFEVNAFQTGPGMMATMFFDITARKQAEEALRESEERYKTLTNNLHVGIYRNTTGPKGKFIEANPAIVEMFGYQDRNEFKAVNVANLYQNPNDREKYNEEMLKKGSVKDYEVRLKRKNGTLFIGSVSAVAVKDSNGEVKYFDGIIEDITGKKELEMQLQQSQKMEAIGTLAGGIAHDFNNILSAILGYTELALIDAERESPLYQSLQEVFRAGERAKDLVKQILTFSRQAEQERKPVLLKPISKEVIKFLRASLPTTIDIQQNIKSDSLAMADPIQIHQLLMNLCTNAAHAMGEKGGMLTVKLLDIFLDEEAVIEHPELKPGPYIEFTISDTGHGIPAHLIDRIFDPFFTTKEKGEGTGMGLSVAHGIVGSCGGKIIASSELGKGTTFQIYIPTVQRDEPKIPIGGEQVPAGTERILFVDDEIPLVDIGKQIIESLGYQVTTRTSSLEALELFRAKPDGFDLVITDMTMPNMTGDVLAKEIIRIKPDIPVILCTGYSARITQQQADSMGIRAFVSKPVIRRDIAETIRSVLGDM